MVDGGTVAQDRITALLKDVQDRLWTERHLLDFLLFKLVAAKLILAADDRRFMSPALAEVEHVIEKLRLAEMERSISVSQLAAEWDVPGDTLTLQKLAERAEEPFGTIFADHRDALLKVAAEIEEVALENRRLASASLTDIQENIGVLMGKPAESTYNDKGRRRLGPTSPRRLDAAL